jgi:hypothetical protein
MDRQHRKKASEVYSETAPVFVEKVSFEKAFPQIERVRVEYKEQGRGIDRLLGDDRTRVREHPSEHDDFGEYINCSNPICYNGGFNIGEILREMVRGRETRREFTKGCQGYEGSPQGRKRYRHCITFFKGVVTITYTETQPEHAS